jgi:hypothetical protein
MGGRFDLDMKRSTIKGGYSIIQMIIPLSGVPFYVTKIDESTTSVCQFSTLLSRQLPDWMMSPWSVLAIVDVRHRVPRNELLDISFKGSSSNAIVAGLYIALARM